MRISGLMLSMLLTLAACASYEDVRTANPQVTVEELVLAGKSGQTELASGLDQLLQIRAQNPQKYSAEKTIETVIALKKLGPSKAQESLIALLEDQNEEVRFFTVSAVGEIRDSQVIPPLYQATHDEDILVAEEASRKLSQLTLFPIHKEGDDNASKWEKWWQHNRQYFVETRKKEASQ